MMCMLRGFAVLSAAFCLGLSQAAAAEPKVLVTLKPIHALAAAVMQGAGAPDLLLEGAASPHAYAMKPSDSRRLAAADVVVRVSEGLETFLAKPLASLPKRVRVLTLEKVPGLTLHALRTGADFEVHAHEGHAHEAERHAHGAKGHGKNGIDSHLWLDPANGRLIALHLAEVLAVAAPEHALRYRQNAAALAARIEALDNRLSGELKPLAGRPYLVFHDAYQYFERHYGLTSAGAIAVSPDVPPSAQRLRKIRALLAAKGAVCVFSEPQFPPRTVDTVVERTNVRRGTLDPLGAALPAGPAQYFEVLEGLARDLKGCLAEPA